MIRLLFILIFLLIHLNVNAQCIKIQSGSACLNDDGETSLNFIQEMIVVTQIYMIGL